MPETQFQSFILNYSNPLKILLLVTGSILIVLGSFFLRTAPILAAGSLVLGVLFEVGVAYIYREEFLKIERRITNARKDVGDTQDEISITKDEINSAREEIQNAQEEIESIQSEVEVAQKEIRAARRNIHEINTEMSNDVFDDFGQTSLNESLESRVDNHQERLDEIQNSIKEINRDLGSGAGGIF